MNNTNSKFEARNPKQIINSNVQIQSLGFGFKSAAGGIVSEFDFSIFNIGALRPSGMPRNDLELVRK
jgi:hypothetical protein